MKKTVGLFIVILAGFTNQLQAQYNYTLKQCL